MYYTERRGDSSSAQMTLAPYICSWVSRKSQFLHRNHVRGALDFTGSEHQSQYNFSRSTALERLFNRYVLGSISFVLVCTLSQKIDF